MSNNAPDSAVADELAIRNLIAQLAQLADDGALDDYIQCFSEDAVWGGANFGEKKGLEEIMAGAVERRGNGTSGPGTHTRHVITTTTVSLGGDRASARSIFHFYTSTNATPTLQLMGIYDDEFLRADDGWKLSRRNISR